MYYKQLPDFIVPGKWQDEKACTDSVAIFFSSQILSTLGWVNPRSQNLKIGNPKIAKADCPHYMDRSLSGCLLLGQRPLAWWPVFRVQADPGLRRHFLLFSWNTVGAPPTQLACGWMWRSTSMLFLLPLGYVSVVPLFRAGRRLAHLFIYLLTIDCCS